MDALKDSATCKQKMFEDLKDRLLPKPQAAKTFPIVLTSRQPWIDNQSIGAVHASSSSIEIWIANKLIVQHSLDESTKDHETRLAAGTYDFAIVAVVFLVAEL